MNSTTATRPDVATAQRLADRLLDLLEDAFPCPACGWAGEETHGERCVVAEAWRWREARSAG